MSHARAAHLVRGVGADVLVAARDDTLAWLGAAPRATGTPPDADVAVAVHRIGEPLLEVSGATGLASLLADAPGRIGVDGPAALGMVQAALGCVDSVVDVSDELRRARARKTAAEVASVERAASVATVGQEALRAAVRDGAGRTELELWASVQAAMDVAAGERVEAMADLMAGLRTCQVGLPPGPHLVRSGDLVLCDIAPRVNATWADSCSTVTARQPGLSVRRAHDVVRRALDQGLACLRPGRTADDVASAVLAILGDAGFSLPHHVGHGVGWAPFEWPVIVPGSKAVLEAGMVIALEPGVYGVDGVGLRLEHLAVVEEGGPRVLTTHDLALH